jgi:Predicted glycosyltransferases
MKIFLFIPVVYNEYINNMLDCVFKNTRIPDTVMVIDNSKNGLDLPAPVEILRPDMPLGVNASWNLGIKKALEEGADLISIFNDDLLLEKYFFQKMESLANKHKEISVFCPRTFRKLRDFNRVANNDGYKPGDFLECIQMGRREGWAWTIRSEMANKVPPIPQTLETFFGDDWYWNHCNIAERPWYRMMTVWCYHFVGKTVTESGVRDNLENERIISDNLTRFI